MLALGLLTTSCKKTYTCECTTNTSVTVANVPAPYNKFTLTSKSESKAYSAKMTEKRAQSACDHEAQTIQSTEEDALKKNAQPGFEFSPSTSCILR